MKLRKWTRFGQIIALLLLLLIIAAVLSLRFGAVNTPLREILAELSGGEPLVLKYRLPRLIIAVLTGINMAVAGAILQSVTRNPLAAPDIVGVTAGGGFGAVVVLLVFPTWSAAGLPIAAFAGAVTAAVIVYLFAYQRGGIRPTRLALTGVSVSLGFHSLITFLIVKYALDSSQALVWLKGSLYARSWQHVEMLWPWTLGGVLLALLSHRQINTLQLDEDTVTGLGLRIQLVRVLLLLTAVGLSASSVAVSGTIGFVGLVIPPLSKWLVGPDSRLYLPVSALLGALLVTLADLLGRVVLPPLEIPAGIFTALIGVPYFIYLLLIRRAQPNKSQSR
ncbi:FecCD family ABC transporter permease [Paenibacillus sp. NPDC057934]|uniref:FecCD family ABC transporter permease n=1 Tax=Paenibacillus sp. NPDC057934 TaxID=3346282 RepID=UPI0036DB0925